MHLKYLHLSVRKQQEIGTNLNKTVFYFIWNSIASDIGKKLFTYSLLCSLAAVAK